MCAIAASVRLQNPAQLRLHAPWPGPSARPWAHHAGHGRDHVRHGRGQVRHSRDHVRHGRDHMRHNRDHVRNSRDHVRHGRHHRGGHGAR